MKTGPRTPWLALTILGAALGCMCLAWAVGTLHLQPPRCQFKALFGIPCATCGGTRCVLALTGGHLGEAFHWHPVLALLGILSPLALLWDLRRAWRGEPYPLPSGKWAPLTAATLLAATWLLQLARGL